MSYIAWELPDTERQRLLVAIPPTYPDVVAHHVTYQFPATDQDPLPGAVVGLILGVSDNRDSVQALVVSINGSTRRPDGGTYHITWSLDRAKGARPVDSNAVIARLGITASASSLVKLVPKFYPDSEGKADVSGNR